jgi:hypothetical protein
MGTAVALLPCMSSHVQGVHVFTFIFTGKVSIKKKEKKINKQASQRVI